MECKQCHKKVGKPQVAFRVLVVLPTAVLTGFVLGIFATWAKGQGVSWGVWSVAIVAIPSYLFFSTLFWELPRWMTKLRYGLKPCPHCGSHDWAPPQYSGFGI